MTPCAHWTTRYATGCESRVSRSHADLPLIPGGPLEILRLTQLTPVAELPQRDDDAGEGDNHA